MPVPKVDQAVERPFEELAQKASQQALVLAREQVDLARRELAARASQAGPGVAMVGGGAVLAGLGSGTGTAALILLLARRPAASAAALGVTAGYVGAGAFLARQGLVRLREIGPSLDDVPVQDDAVQDAEQDLRAAEQHVKSAAKSTRRAKPAAKAAQQTKSAAKSARLTKPAAKAARPTKSAAKAARPTKSAAKAARPTKSAAKAARPTKSAANAARRTKSAAKSAPAGRPDPESKTPSSRRRASGTRTDGRRRRTS